MNSKLVLPVKDQLHLATDSVPVMTWVSGIDKLCFFFNKSWLEFTGRTLEQECGEGWTKGIHPDDQKKWKEAYSDSFNSCNPFQIKYRLKRHDGEYKWLINNAVPHYDDHGHFAGYIGSCIDINEIAEEENLRDEFINSAGNELKIPVTTIKVYAQLLEDFFARAGEEKHLIFLKKINKQVVKLTRLINNLGEINKIYYFGVELNKTSFDFNILLLEEISRVQSEFPKHNIQLNGYISHNVYGDRERLAQAFNNLLDNAIKFSPDADKIVISIKGNSDSFTVSVLDYGIGISNKEKDKIFTRFYKGNENTANTFPGLGLGLYISSQIIKYHGGEIQAENVISGSKLSFKLPYDNRT